MGENSKIEWCHHTFNPWRGCSRVSPGCDHCYAETMSHRNPAVLGIWGDDGTRVIASENYWRAPLKWNADAARAGERRRVFCLSLGDVLENLKVLDAPRRRLFDLIKATPNLDWLLLTKRPENAGPIWWDTKDKSVISACKLPSNVWLGVSVENQETANKRIPILLNIPARVRFLSCEPLLGPVDLNDWIWGNRCRDPQCGDSTWDHACQLGEQRLHWVICGGESGAQARPMHHGWARSLRDQCVAADVPFFFKQWGEFLHVTRSEDDSHLVDVNGNRSEFSDVSPDWALNSPKGKWLQTTDSSHGHFAFYHRVGKAAAGRLLDGREWNEVPREAVSA